ncbi:hypothetical protein [Spartinivicinus ruber]|uniref:hypothetical protein n=1 Tax=Spartinivicinus ruber TaxID=2683272 RepID=UPI0013D11E50|nr:hypothetical protein [Spartinivicinus ruber]
MKLIKLTILTFIFFSSSILASNTTAIPVNFYGTNKHSIYYQKTSFPGSIYYLPKLKTKIRKTYESSRFDQYQVSMGFGDFSINNFRNEHPEYSSFIIYGDTLTAKENCTFSLKDDENPQNERRILSKLSPAGSEIKGAEFHLTKIICTFDVRILKTNTGWQDWEAKLLTGVTENKLIENPFGSLNLISKLSGSISINLSQLHKNIYNSEFISQKYNLTQATSYFLLGSAFLSDKELKEKYDTLANDDEKQRFIEFLYQILFRGDINHLELIDIDTLDEKYTFTCEQPCESNEATYIDLLNL